jgi:hypothetical protein
MIGKVIGDMPHPKAPSLRVREYRATERAAGMMKNPNQAGPEDVVKMHELLKSAGMSAAEFEHTWELARPIANRFLGRDPRPQELAQFVGAHPADVHDYYSSHPYPGHEEVKAGDFVKYHHAATPIAQMTLGRKPLPVEVARFAAAGYQTEDIQSHYAHKGKPGG